MSDERVIPCGLVDFVKIIKNWILLTVPYMFDIFFFFKLFLFPRLGGSALRPKIFTLCTIFGRMLGIEPELLRTQRGVLPMSYTHP